MFEHAVEDGITGLVLEVRDQDGNRFELLRLLHRAAGQEVGSAEHRHHEHRTRRHQARSHAPHQRQRLAVLVQALERRHQIGGLLVARLGIDLHTAGHDAGHRLGDLGIDRTDVGHPLLHPLGQFGHGARTALGTGPAHEHVVENQAEGVDVRAMVDALAARLFRGHVGERADDPAFRLGHEYVDRTPGLGSERTGLRSRPAPGCSGHRPRRAPGNGPGGALGRSGHGPGVPWPAFRHREGDPEIHDQGLVFGDHDVGGLEIPVNHARLMRGPQAVRHLPGDDEGPREGKMPAPGQQLRQVFPVDVRHGQVLDAVDLAEVVNADHVRVRHLPGQEQFPLEAPDQLLAARRVLIRRRSDDLHGHGDAEFRVPGLVDRAHAACAEQTDDVIARAEGLAYGQDTRAAGSRRARRWVRPPLTGGLRRAAKESVGILNRDLRLTRGLRWAAQERVAVLDRSPRLCHQGLFGQHPDTRVDGRRRD